MAIKEGELLHYDPLNEEIEVNLIEDDIIRDGHLQPVIMPCSSMRTDSGKTMYWSKKKMLAHAEKYSQAFEGMAGRDRWNSWKPGRSRKKTLWKYSSSGSRILTAWH